MMMPKLVVKMTRKKINCKKLLSTALFTKYPPTAVTELAKTGFLGRIDHSFWGFRMEERNRAIA